MLDLIVNIAYTAVIMTFGVVLTQPIPPTELHGVAQVEAKPISTIFSSERHCRFYGVVVPYERDWEIVSENTMTHTKTVLSPELGKIHEYAVLINKKTCPGKDSEHLLLSGSASPSWRESIGIPKSRKIMLSTVSQKLEDQPKWLPQVMKVIEAAEPTQPFVKEFLDYSRAGEPEAKPTPEVAANAEITVAEPAETNSAQQ